MSRYKQDITIGMSVDGIFKLPCVHSCHKNGNGLHYFTVEAMNERFADVGDKLCEDYDGCWWVEKPTIKYTDI